MKKLICIGDTRPAKESLKARGWKWNPEAGHWYRLIDDATAARIAAGDEAARKEQGGQKMGCRLILDGRIVWQSKTYAETQQRGVRRYADPEGWNCDAAGNRVQGIRIPGSAPDDMV